MSEAPGTARSRLETARRIVEIAAVIGAACFAAWKWGWEVAWERAPNHDLYFWNHTAATAEATYLLKSPGGAGQCRIEGLIRIDNNSVAPMHIERTRLGFFTFRPDRCVEGARGEDCMRTNSASSVLRRLCDDDASCAERAPDRLVVHPVDDRPIFGGDFAARPFNVTLPESRFVAEDGERLGLFVLAEQEVGVGCGNGLFGDCEIHRVSITDLHPCPATATATAGRAGAA